MKKLFVGKKNKEADGVEGETEWVKLSPGTWKSITDDIQNLLCSVHRVLYTVRGS